MYWWNPENHCPYDDEKGWFYADANASSSIEKVVELLTPMAQVCIARTAQSRAASKISYRDLMLFPSSKHRAPTLPWCLVNYVLPSSFAVWWHQYERRISDSWHELSGIVCIQSQIQAVILFYICWSCCPELENFGVWSWLQPSKLFLLGFLAVSCCYSPSPIDHSVQDNFEMHAAGILLTTWSIAAGRIEWRCQECRKSRGRLRAGWILQDIFLLRMSGAQSCVSWWTICHSLSVLQMTC